MTGAYRFPNEISVLEYEKLPCSKKLRDSKEHQMTYIWQEVISCRRKSFGPSIGINSLHS